MRHFRSSRGSRNRSLSTVIQSFKKVINHAPASRTVTTIHVFNISTGEDSVAAGQTSVTDVSVPTGSVMRAVEIQYSVSQLVSQAAYFWTTIQRLESGQAQISGRTVGGNPQRNQVHRQGQFMVGDDQNSNHVIRFPIPKRFQRVKDGSKWIFTIESDVVHNSAVQIIYKFYR